MKKCLACDSNFESENWTCPNCNKSPEKSGNFLVFSPEFAYENPGFEARFFDDLAVLEEENYWFRARNQLVIWALGKYFPGIKTYLEIGCGTGYVLTGIRERFPHIEMSGSELLLAGLPFAEGRLPGVTLYQMDACAIPFIEEFDTTSAFDVLEHIEEDQMVLGQMHQACKPGGGIILTVPQHQFLWSVLDDYSLHKRRYSRKDLLEKLEKAGFTPLRTTSYVSLLMPLLLISRMGNSKTKDSPDIVWEFNLNPIINFILESVLAFERYLIERGISFPLGGSLLVIAKKDVK